MGIFDDIAKNASNEADKIIARQKQQIALKKNSQQQQPPTYLAF